MATPKKKISKPSWIVQFKSTGEEINLYNHIDFMQRWWPGLIWVGGAYSKTSNILMDTTGRTYLFSKVTARSQGLDKPFPSEPLFLIDAFDTIVIVTEQSFYAYGKKLLNSGKKGQNFWGSYLKYLMEFALVTYTREEWEDYKNNSNIVIVR